MRSLYSPSVLFTHVVLENSKRGTTRMISRTFHGSIVLPPGNSGQRVFKAYHRKAPAVYHKATQPIVCGLLMSARESREILSLLLSGCLPMNSHSAMITWRGVFLTGKGISVSRPQCVTPALRRVTLTPLCPKPAFLSDCHTAFRVEVLP
jgi:hypothetical protein